MGPRATNPCFAQQPRDGPLKRKCGAIRHTILHIILGRRVFSIEIGAVKGFENDHPFPCISVLTWRTYDICTIGGSAMG